MINEATKLSIARTLIHESMHAYINLQINQKDITSEFWKSLTTYYNIYNNSNLSQHNFITQFVDAIAYSLSVYDNHNQNISYYTSLSWAGLESTNAYKSKTQTQKDAIQEIIINERYAKSDAKSTKCN